MDGVGTPYTGISPPAVLTGCPLCLRRPTSSKWTAPVSFRLRRKLTYSVISPLPTKSTILWEPYKMLQRSDCGWTIVSPRYTGHRPRPATVCLCAEGCSPYTSFLKLGSWPAQSRTAFLSGAYRMYPMYLFSFQAVASPHGCTAADPFVPNGDSVEMCLKLSRISRREQKRKAAERRLSLSIRFSDMRPSCQ